MKYYIELTLIVDREIALGFLWQKVFQQVHLALVENKVSHNCSDIAISIPSYNTKGFPLGNKLRLIAKSQEKLELLSIEGWLKRLSDYCHITPITEVPQNRSFACFRRAQVKTIENKAKRRSKKLNITYEEALSYFKKNDKTTKLRDLPPFIRVESQSTKKDGHKHRFPLYIKKIEKDNEVQGTYDCYGLSKTATVPIF